MRELYWSLLRRYHRVIRRARTLAVEAGWLAVVRWYLSGFRRSGLQTITVSGLPHPITLRYGTSDRAVFRGVFLDGEYDEPVPPPCGRSSMRERTLD